MVAWLYSLLVSVKAIHDNDFLPTIEQLRDDLKYNSDTAVVEYMLRKRLFENAPSVFIRNVNEEARDVFIGRGDDPRYELIIGRGTAPNMNVTLNRNGAQNSVYLDFEVIVVNTEKYISDDTKFQMIAYLNKYKIGKKYEIKYQDNEMIYQCI